MLGSFGDKLNWGGECRGGICLETWTNLSGREQSDIGGTVPSVWSPGWLTRRIPETFNLEKPSKIIKCNLQYWGKLLSILTFFLFFLMCFSICNLDFIGTGSFVPSGHPRQLVI